MNEAALQSGDSANQQHVVEVTGFFFGDYLFHWDVAIKSDDISPLAS